MEDGRPSWDPDLKELLKSLSGQSSVSVELGETTKLVGDLNIEEMKKFSRLYYKSEVRLMTVVGPSKSLVIPQWFTDPGRDH